MSLSIHQQVATTCQAFSWLWGVAKQPNGECWRCVQYLELTNASLRQSCLSKHCHHWRLTAVGKSSRFLLDWNFRNQHGCMIALLAEPPPKEALVRSALAALWSRLNSCKNIIRVCLLSISKKQWFSMNFKFSPIFNCDEDKQDCACEFTREAWILSAHDIHSTRKEVQLLNGKLGLRKAAISSPQ